MPNHVTNIVESSAEVISALMKDGKPTFNKVSPVHPDLKQFRGVICSAEHAAEMVCGNAFSDNPLIASLERSNRSKINVTEFDDDTFRQFIAFVENKRKHGYYHSMEFARERWGTKWGPYDFDESRSSDAKIVFNTAWSCPVPLLKDLSEKFPEQKIVVTYADEDIGCNCGVMELLGGNVVEETNCDCPGVDWTAFACNVKGMDYDEYMSDMDE